MIVHDDSGNTSQRVAVSKYDSYLERRMKGKAEHMQMQGTIDDAAALALGFIASTSA